MEMYVQNYIFSEEQPQMIQGVQEDQNQQFDILPEKHDVYKNIYNSLVKVHCDNCGREITTKIQITFSKKAVCVNCFCEKEEIQNDLQCFYVQEKLNFQLMIQQDEPKWTALEELLLLEGLSKYGFGNWNDIKEIINNNSCYKQKKTTAMVRRHYEQTYLQSLIPHYQKYFQGCTNILKQKQALEKQIQVLTRSLQEVDKEDHLLINGDIQDIHKQIQQLDSELEALQREYRKIKQDQSYYLPEQERFCDNKERVENNSGSGQSQKKQMSERQEETVQEEGQPRETRQECRQQNQIHESLGYMPKRGDFEHEYDNDAELILAEMEFNDEDSAEIIRNKEEILQIYNARLDQRIRRKEFVIEHELLDFQKIIRKEKQMQKDEREVHNMMKEYARFSSKEQHDQLCKLLVDQLRMEKKIQELKQYKAQGFTTIKDIENYHHKQNDTNPSQDYKDRKKQMEQFIDNNKPITNANYSRRTTRTNKDTHETKDKYAYISPDFTQQELDFSEKHSISYADYRDLKNIIIFQNQEKGSVDLEIISSLGFSYDIEKLDAVLDFLASIQVITKRIS